MLGQGFLDLLEKTLQTESIATQDNLMAEKKEMKLGREYKTPKKAKIESILKSPPPVNYPSMPTKTEGLSRED